MLQTSDLEVIKRGHLNRSFGNNEYLKYDYHGDGLRYFASKNGSNLYSTLLGGDYEYCFVSSFKEKYRINLSSEDNTEILFFTEIFESIRTLLNVNSENCKPDSDLIRNIYYDASEFINKLDLNEIKIVEDFGPGNLHILILLLIRNINGLNEITDIILRECSLPHYTSQYLIIKYLSTIKEFKERLQSIEYGENYDKVDLIYKSHKKLIIHHIPTWLQCSYMPDLTIYSNVLGEITKDDLESQIRTITNRYAKNKTIVINGGLFKAITGAKYNFGYGTGVGVDTISRLSEEIEDLSFEVNLEPPRYSIMLNKNFKKGDITNLEELNTKIEDNLNQQYSDCVWIDENGIIIESKIAPLGESIFNYLNKEKKENYYFILKGELNKVFLNKFVDCNLKIADILQYSDYIYLLNLKND